MYHSAWNRHLYKIKDQTEHSLDACIFTEHIETLWFVGWVAVLLSCGCFSLERHDFNDYICTMIPSARFLIICLSSCTSFRPVIPKQAALTISLCLSHIHRILPRALFVRCHINAAMWRRCSFLPSSMKKPQRNQSRSGWTQQTLESTPFLPISAHTCTSWQSSSRPRRPIHPRHLARRSADTSAIDGSKKTKFPAPHSCVRQKLNGKGREWSCINLTSCRMGARDADDSS